MPILPILGWPLTHGWATALICALLLTPAIPALLVLGTERRAFHPTHEFTALVYGDPMLAGFIAIGAALGAAHAISAPAWLWTVPGTCLAFGLWQWRSETRTGMYTKAQALAPSKIYHQLAIYPVLGYWLWAAAWAGVTAPTESPWTWVAKAAMVALIGGWGVLLAYDQQHPKLGHTPFDWRRFAPAPKPWGRGSVALRAADDA